MGAALRPDGRPLRPDSIAAELSAGSGLLRTGPANPIADGVREASKGTQQDLYFFTSIEDFPPGIGDLGLDPHYGRYFFEEWNSAAKKPFSTAFMDASWRISSNQVPVVTATGATRAEASARLFNERAFSGDRANTSWYWWRWYDAARARNQNLRIPSGARSAAPRRRARLRRGGTRRGQGGRLP
jgi:hypothetical protein